MSRIIPILFILFLIPFASAQSTRIEMDDPGWTSNGADTRVEEYLGHKALRMRTGRAFFRPIDFQDGTIEFDMAVTPYRSFVYLIFHMRNDDDYEEVYFRPHHPGAPDAIQYSPVYQGSSNWQLYHQPGYTGEAEFNDYTWMPIRLVVQGTRAAVFVGADERPELIIPRLAHGSRGGYIALGSFLPQGLPAGVTAASFANLTVRPGHIPYDFSDAPPMPEPPDGLILEWLVSPAFNPPSLDIRELPMEMGSDWRVLGPDPTGLLVFGKEVDYERGQGVWAVWAKVVIRSEADVVRRLNLGFSDAVTVFLNGRPLFSGDDSYSPNDPRRQGLLALGQASVYLPLKQGENELVIAVSDRFGGWGLMAQLEDLSGLEVWAR